MEGLNFEALTDAKIDQWEFAELIGVSRGAVNNWVNDRSRVHSARIVKVKKYLAAIASGVAEEQLPLSRGIALTPDERMTVIRQIILIHLKKG